MLGPPMQSARGAAHAAQLPRASPLRTTSAWQSRGVSRLVDISLVRAVVTVLVEAGLPPLVFGGWAEELHGLRQPRSHSDVDLLLVQPSPSRLQTFLANADEIEAKRFSHKRAFLFRGVLVELFLVRRSAHGHVTDFWDGVEWQWPSLSPVRLRGLPVAPREALVAYRTAYRELRSYRTRLDTSA